MWLILSGFPGDTTPIDERGVEEETPILLFLLLLILPFALASFGTILFLVLFLWGETTF
jgi:hypothetical protein